MKEKMKLCRADGENKSWIWQGVNGTLSSLTSALPGIAQIIGASNGTLANGDTYYYQGVAETSTNNNRMLLIGGIALVLIIVLVVIITSSRK